MLSKLRVVASYVLGASMASEWLTPSEGAAQAAKPSRMQAAQANVITRVLHPGLGPVPKGLVSLFWIIGLEGACEPKFD